MIETINVKSDALSSDVILKVVRPDEGRVDSLMILLHGNMRPEARAEYLDGFPLELNLEELSNQYHLVVVTPLMKNRYYISTPDYDCDRYIAQELPAYIKERYSIADSAEIILAGISMGGFGATLIAAHSGTFHKMISISGAYIAKDIEIGSQEVWGNLTPLASGIKKTFLYYFLPLDDLSDSTQRNALAALRLFTDQAEKSFFFVSCGTKEDLLYKRNLDFVKELERLNLGYQFFPIEGGEHKPDCFKEGLWEAMKFYKEKEIE